MMPGTGKQPVDGAERGIPPPLMMRNARLVDPVSSASLAWVRCRLLRAARTRVDEVVHVHHPIS
jgi:hypothetical protein